MLYSKSTPDDEAQPTPSPNETFYIPPKASSLAGKIAPLIAAHSQQRSFMLSAPENLGKQIASSSQETSYSLASPSDLLSKFAYKNLLVNDLAEAVECGNFRINFQPIVSLHDGSLTGVEACVQWKNRGKFVPASYFIPLAASCGLIDKLGMWVIRHACARMKPVMARSKPGFRLAVNVFPLQLESHSLPLAIEEGLASAHIRPENFEIEISDQMQGCSMPVIRDAVKLLHQIGISVALDEFGAGFSSIESLRCLRVNRIKIHESISAATRARWPIFDGIAQMAKVLGIPIVATGIDTLRRLERVRAAGCQEVQGHRIAKSVSAPEILFLMPAKSRFPTELGPFSGTGQNKYLRKSSKLHGT